ncbi:MAG: glycosyltransferase family 2 protein [Theionarchaea archaeon]|nr:glycosyltransferase family 2 protein [Theionarchaea archaeon]
MTESTEAFYSSPSSSMEEKVSVRDKPSFTCGLDDERKRLSVVVPLYNEEDNVYQVVDDLERMFASSGFDGEIILIDDGSTDRTLEIARQLQKEYSHVNIIPHGTNLGKTAAMITGFQHATGDYVILMDGDGQFLAKDIPKMVEKLKNGFDVVNGWGKKKEPLTKIIPSLVYNGISRKLFSLNVHQFNLGFKAFKREALDGLILKKDEHRYILPLLKEKGFAITEIPVAYLPRQNGTSKYGVMRIPFGVMDMVSLKIELVLGERPFRVFGLASLGLVLSGIISGLYGVYGLVTGSGTMWPAAFSTMFLLSGITILFVGYAVEAATCPRK